MRVKREVKREVKEVGQTGGFQVKKARDMVRDECPFEPNSWGLLGLVS